MHADFVVFLKVIDGALNVASVTAQDLSEACDRQAAQAVTVVGAKVDDHQDSQVWCLPAASAGTRCTMLGSIPFMSVKKRGPTFQAGEFALAQDVFETLFFNKAQDRFAVNPLVFFAFFGIEVRDALPSGAPGAVESGWIFIEGKGRFSIVHELQGHFASLRREERAKMTCEIGQQSLFSWVLVLLFWLVVFASH